MRAMPPPSLTQLMLESLGELCAGNTNELVNKEQTWIAANANKELSWESLFVHLRLVPGLFATGKPLPEPLVEAVFQYAQMLIKLQRPTDPRRSCDVQWTGEHSPKYLLVHQPITQFRLYYGYECISHLCLSNLKERQVKEVTRVHFPGLKYLSISKSPGVRDESLGKAVRNFIKLYHLELSNCENITPELLQWISFGSIIPLSETNEPLLLKSSFALQSLSIQHCNKFKFRSQRDLLGLFSFQETLVALCVDLFATLDPLYPSSIAQVTNWLYTGFTVGNAPNSINVFLDRIPFEQLEMCYGFRSITKLHINSSQVYSGQDIASIANCCPLIVDLSISQLRLNDMALEMVGDMKHIQVFQAPYSFVELSHEEIKPVNFTSLILHHSTFVTPYSPIHGIYLAEIMSHHNRPTTLDYRHSKGKDDVSPMIEEFMLDRVRNTNFDQLEHLDLGNTNSVSLQLLLEVFGTESTQFIRSLSAVLSTIPDNFSSLNVQKLVKLEHLCLSNTPGELVDRLLEDHMFIESLDSSTTNPNQLSEDLPWMTNQLRHFQSQSVENFCMLVPNLYSLDLSNISGQISCSTILSLPFSFPQLCHLKLPPAVTNTHSYRFDRSEETVLFWLATHRLSKLKEYHCDKNSDVLQMQTYGLNTETIGAVTANLMRLLPGLEQFVTYDQIISTHTVESLKTTSNRMYCELIHEHKLCLQQHELLATPRRKSTRCIDDNYIVGKTIAQVLLPRLLGSYSITGDIEEEDGEELLLHKDIPTVAVPKCMCEDCVESFPELYRDQTKIVYSIEKLYQIGRNLKIGEIGRKTSSLSARAKEMGNCAGSTSPRMKYSNAANVPLRHSGTFARDWRSRHSAAKQL